MFEHLRRCDLLLAGAFQCFRPTGCSRRSRATKQRRTVLDDFSVRGYFTRRPFTHIVRCGSRTLHKQVRRPTYPAPSDFWVWAHASASRPYAFAGGQARLCPGNFRAPSRSAVRLRCPRQTLYVTLINCVSMTHLLCGRPRRRRTVFRAELRARTKCRPRPQGGVRLCCRL